MADPVAQAVVPASDDPAYRNGLRPVPADQGVAGTALPASSSAASTAPVPDHEELRRQIDALSLSQALLDFEVANARVLDLTARLVDASRQVGDLQKANDGLRADLEASKAEIERLEKRYRRLVASTSYRWANRLWTIRKALTKG